jgi:hypothetical protein
MEEGYRGYSIMVEDRGLYFRIYVSPTKPELPIFHSNRFEWWGSREEALEMARRRIDALLGGPPR